MKSGKKIGAGSTVKWPTGLGGKGNDGIAAFEFSVCRGDWLR